MIPQISVIIPCYNEAKILFQSYEELTFELKKTNRTYEIIFCNDGSTDNTFEKLNYLKKLDDKVKIIGYYPNRGAGYAFRQLSKNATGGIIIHMDADLAMKPQDTLDLFLYEIKSHDIVVGSRYGKIKAEFPLSRLIPSKILLFINRFLFECPLIDTNSGFFAVKRKVLETVKLNSDDFQIYAELFIKALKNNFLIKEMPVKFIHKTESGEVSVLKHFCKVLKDIFNLWFELRNEKRRI